MTASAIDEQMARSVHVTKKELIRERWFAHTDAVPQSSGATELERKDIQKSLHKANEVFRRQAIRDDAPCHAELTLKASELSRKVRKRRTRQ